MTPKVVLSTHAWGLRPTSQTGSWRAPASGSIMACLLMPPSEPSRVFISYARKDGSALAQRLQKDLNENGYEAWLDKQRIEGGASWTNTIEEAIDSVDYVLALLTQGSYVSESCRAEQLRSLRKGKCVIPLKAQSDADVPLHLEARNYRDFTIDSTYAKSFQEPLGDINAKNGIPLKDEFRQTLRHRASDADQLCRAARRGCRSAQRRHDR